jgi:outer membrane receptor for ferrienterochelin and colicins
MLNKYSAILILFYVLLVSPLPVHADNSLYALKELSLEQLMDIEVESVYGASRFEQKVTEAPSSVSIITADDIKKYGYRTLADVLRSVRSFQITNDRNYSYIGVRGFGRTGDYNSRILLLVDGHRINDNIYNQALIGEDFIIDIDLIERVEVIRGPGSSLYGNSAYLAVINVITRKAADFSGVETSGAAGSFRTVKGRVSYGNLLGADTYAVFSASGLDSKGPHRLFYKEYNSPETNNGITVNTDYERNQSFFAKIGTGDLTLESAFVSRMKGIPTGSFESDFNDRNNRTIDQRYYLDLKYEHRLDDGATILGRISYDVYYFWGTYISSGVHNRDYADGQWVDAEVMYSRKIFDSHKITVGTDYQFNIKQRQVDYDIAPYQLYLDDNTRTNKLGIYVQDEYSILKNLILNIGVRFDHFGTFGNTTNPRVALIYAPAEKTAIKLIYGTAFRAPNNFELYYQVADSQMANPNLRPEKITTYETVLEQYFGKHLRGTAAAFYNRIRNLIEQQTDAGSGLLVFRNTDKVEAKGLEFELEGVWDGGYRAKASYTVQDAKDKTDNASVVNSPRHLAKVNVTLPVWSDKLFAGVEEQFMSSRRTLAGASTGSVYLTNATLFSQKIIKNLEFSGSIYNIFNKKYGDPGGEEHLQDIIEQDGRSFRIKLTCKF